jgi:ribose transport system permease protein
VTESRRAACWRVVRPVVPLVLALAGVFLLFGALLAIQDHHQSGIWRLPTIALPGTIEKMIIYTVVVGIAALGATLVIISAGIDLSAGSVIALGGVMTALCLRSGWPPVLAACGGMGAGLLCGLVNGVIIAKCKVVPFIVTLGTLLVVRGLAKGLAGGMPINVESSWLNELLAVLPADKKWMLFPPGAWVMFGLAAFTAAFLRYTRLGRHIVAVGSNELTARLCGVAVERVKIFVYAAAGAFAGLSGLMLMSYQEQGDPTGAIGHELEVIAAVVIGGASLSGGLGSIPGTLVGAMIMVVIKTGCQLMGWEPWVTQVVTGTVIIVAVALDRFRHAEG